MPNKTSLKLTQNRKSHRRQSVMGLAVAASLGLVAGCNSTGSTGTNVDMAGGGGGDPDMSLPVDPPPGSHRVTVTLNGTGSVVSQPAGISCGIGTMQCAGDFVDNTTVLLTATGSAGSVFNGWSGACAGQGAACTLKISADVTTDAKFGPQSCSADGVCWEAPLPFGYDLNSVYALSATDAWAVGNAGASVHWDGTSWKFVPTGVNLDLTDVWARSANDVWATAGAKYMMHYTGPAAGWTLVDTGNPNINVRVWGTTNKLYVATQVDFVLVFSGGTWTKQSLAAAGARTDTAIGAITGTADNDIWAFGADNFICHYVAGWSCTRGNINTEVNFAGTSGAIALSPTNIWQSTSAGYISNCTTASTSGFAYPVSANRVPGNSSYSLWGTASNSLFTNGQGALMYRYNGNAWTPFDAGVKDIVNMAKVHGTAATDVWSVGKRGVIVHFNGTAASVNRGNIFNGTNITGSWASGANDAWFTTNGGTVLHYDGAAFRESSALVTGGGAALSSVYGLSPTDIWAGGTDGVGPVMKHWDGTTWNPAPMPGGFLAQSVTTVFAASKTLAFASGYPSKGVIKWDGTSWKNDTSLGAQMTDYTVQVWGSSDSNVFAVENGTTKLWVYNGVSWSQDNRINAQLASIGGSGQADVWAGGLQSVWHLDATSMWKQTMITGATGYIKNVSSVSATNAWAVDETGAVFHTTDGTTWKQQATGVSGGNNANLKTFSVNPTMTWLSGTSGILSIRK